MEAQEKERRLIRRKIAKEVDRELRSQVLFTECPAARAMLPRLRAALDKALEIVG